MNQEIKYTTNKADDYYEDEIKSNFNTTDILNINICEADLNESIKNIQSLLEENKNAQFLFINTLQLLKFKRNKKLNTTISKDDFVFGTDSLISWAAKKNNSRTVSVISPTLFLLKLLGLCEKKNLSIFLLGQSESQVDKFYYSITKNFRNLIIMGRQGGFLKRKREQLVREAIKKSSPDIILLPNAFPKQHFWVNKYKEFFEKSIIIYLGETFDLFAGKTSYCPLFFKNRGLKWLWNFLIFPLNLKRLFDIISFFLTVYLKRFKKS